jgi:hypothetical protein
LMLAYSMLLGHVYDVPLIEIFALANELPSEVIYVYVNDNGVLDVFDMKIALDFNT